MTELKQPAAKQHPDSPAPGAMGVVKDANTDLQSADEAGDDVLDARARAWLELELDGTVVVMHRHARWRPTWVVEFKPREGGQKRLFVRAPRGEHWINPVSMRQEISIHQVLEKAGIPVPHMYDSSDAWALVMDVLDGEISIELNSEEPERGVIYGEFVDALARVHDVPVERFGEVGLYVPEPTAADIALNHYERCYDIYLRQMGDHSVPLMDFTFAWLKRNVPEHRMRRSPITGDAGQFLFKDGHLEALIDFEQFYIGDPAADFAGMRLRDAIEPLDIERIIKLYEARTGDFIDKYALEYHSIGFNGVNGWLLWPTSVSTDLEQDYVAYLSFAVGTSRWILQSMALLLNIELPQVAQPAGPQRVAPAMPFQHLVESLQKLAGRGFYAEYNEMKTSALAQHVVRWNDYGAWFVDEDLTAIEALLGERYTDTVTAHAALVRYIKSAGADADEALIRYFHGWLERYEFLLTDCGPQTFLIGRLMKPIDVPWRDGARA